MMSMWFIFLLFCEHCSEDLSMSSSSLVVVMFCVVFLGKTNEIYDWQICDYAFFTLASLDLLVSLVAAWSACLGLAG